MGWSCSWIAVQGVDKAELLTKLTLVETDEEVEAGSQSVPLCVGELKGGWTVFFSNDFFWADQPNLVPDLSHLGLTVGCTQEDHVAMVSVAWAAKDGAEFWRVYHENDPKRLLEVSGEPPAEFEDIRTRLVQAQKEDVGGVDYLYDIPLDLAAAVCGFRPEDDLTPFHVVRPMGWKPPEPPAKLSLLDKLLAPLRPRRY